ncbi:hypothetical protein R3P38DRAFT_3172136 [Favolaschia claudopus]|uniref:Uncharacterized protein n=1 Tax=Favolaschia claudopus TaxID=2862362 RepID=A0AAW0DM58_9AGAR
MSSASRSIYHVFISGHILDAVHPDYFRHTIPASAKYIPPASIYTLMTFEPHSQRHVVRRPPPPAQQARHRRCGDTRGVTPIYVSLQHSSSKLAEIQLQLCTPALTAVVPEEQTPPNVSKSGTRLVRGNGVTATLQAKYRAITSPRFVTSFRLERGLGTTDTRSPRFTTPTPNPQTLNVTKACRVQDFIPHEDRDVVVRGWCAGEDSAIARLDEVRTRMADCTGILDTEVDELTQDLNGCIIPWVRSRLIPHLILIIFLPLLLSPSHLTPPPAPMSVGIHIRWGDTAPPPGTDISTHDFYGSMNFPDIARILTDLRAFSSNPLEITIAMEEAGPRAEEYTLLYSPQTQALDDLRVLSRSDVLLLGESSYGVLTHLLAPPGLTIVKGGGLGKVQEYQWIWEACGLFRRLQGGRHRVASS